MKVRHVIRLPMFPRHVVSLALISVTCNDCLKLTSEKRKGEERKYSAILVRTHTLKSQSAQAWITQFYLQTTRCLPFLRKRSPDGAAPN